MGVIYSAVKWRAIKQADGVDCRKIGQCVILVRPVVQIERAHAVACRARIVGASAHILPHSQLLAVLQHIKIALRV